QLRALQAIRVPAVDLFAMDDRVFGTEVAAQRLQLRRLRLVGEKGDEVAGRVLRRLGNRVLLDDAAELGGGANEDPRLEPELLDHQPLELALQRLARLR